MSLTSLIFPAVLNAQNLTTAVTLWNGANPGPSSQALVVIDISGRGAGVNSTLTLEVRVGGFWVASLQREIETAEGAVRLALDEITWLQGENLTLTLTSDDAGDSNVSLATKIFNRTPLQPKTLGHDLDVNASGHVARVTLVDTRTTNTDMRGTNGANTIVPMSASGVRAAVGLSLSNLDTQLASLLTDSQLQAALPANFVALGITGSGHLNRVALVDTTTTNTDMRGTNGAAMAGSAMTLTPGERTAVATAVESALLNDGDGQALIDAIIGRIESDLGASDLSIAAIATAVRDAILGRLLAGNHDTLGSVGRLLQDNDGDGQALIDAIISRIESDLGASNLSIAAIAAAVRDAVLDRLLAGNHDAAGTLGRFIQDVYVDVAAINARATEARLAKLDRDLATATDVTSARDSIIAQGNAAWLTASGFSTHSTSDVAAVILASPANKLQTNTNGFVSISQTFPANFAALGINASGHIERATRVDTTTTNSDMRGTDGANTASPPSAQEVRDAILDRVLLGNHEVAGSLGEAIPEIATQLQSVIKGGEPRTIARAGKAPITFTETRGS